MAAASVFGTTDAILSLLREDNSILKFTGLQQLALHVDTIWFDVSGHVGMLELLFEDEKYPYRALVAIICAKIYYHLEAYDESLNFALAAEDHFDINKRDQFTKTLLTRCIDRYAEVRRKLYENPSDPSARTPITEKLASIVNRLIERSIAEGEHRYALGIALETRDLAKVNTILDAGAQKELVHYLSDVSTDAISSKRFRLEVLDLVANRLSRADASGRTFADYMRLGEVFTALGRTTQLAELLGELSHATDERQQLLALQLAFDLAANENEAMVARLKAELPESAKSLEPVLSGKITQELAAAFLSNESKADPQVIKELKAAVDTKNSTSHGAVVLSNALMQAGTMSDAFIVENQDWIAKSTHWSRFSATASLGVIYRGHAKAAREKLRPYLFGSLATPNFATHGGALYGLGLVYATTKDEEVIEMLRQAIKDPNHNANESIVHGACLGVGLVGLGSGDLGLFEELKNILFTDNAVIGEAAALAIGLVMVGSLEEASIQELLEYAHETQHEKIIRAIAVSLAMSVLGKEEVADVLLEQLGREKDALLRYGAMLGWGLAYVGTASQHALKILLHVAVSDVSDDVRKAAVTSIGFVLCKEPTQIAKVLPLLAQSFNPHVRYGAATAIGIACAGSASAEALNILEPLLTDATDFVRQGAYIASAMVLQHTSEALEPRVGKLRTQIKEIVGKKHEDTLCRLGGLLAAGILDAGGRNAVISIVSQSGHIKMGACLGLVLFTHFWYWFPLVHCLSLALAPAALIGVDRQLRVPKGFTFKSAARASLFEYPAPLAPKETKDKGAAKTVTLSTTSKAMARAKKTGKMEVEETKKDEKKTDLEEKKEEKKDDPPFTILANPSRVLERQMRYIQFVEENRYRPLLKSRKRGVVVLVDSKPEEEDTYFWGGKAPASKPGDEEPKPPEEFVFDEEGHAQTVAQSLGRR